MLWAGAAVAMQAWLLSGAWPRFWVWVLLFALGAAGATAWNRRAVSLVLVFAYVFPLLIRLLHGRYHAYFALLWLAPLFGAMLPQALRTPWQVPARWRLWLAAWAWMIAAAAMAVMLRESDFYPRLAANEGVAGPIFAAQWILNVSLILVLGILWFDWLCGAGDLDAAAWIAAPLAVSCAVLAAVAIYQGLVDINFYNESLFGVLGRATGTMFDGNVSAMIAAFWVGGALWLGERDGHVRWPIVVPAMLVAWMAVWATASRTGFGVAAIATFCIAVVGWREYRGSRFVWSWRRGLVAMAVLAAGAAALAALLSMETGPIQRLATMLPDRSVKSFAALASELWNRNRYGEVATTLIRQHPWAGIGIGAFSTLASEFAASRLGVALVPDNAQNWYRHQLVEFGLLGSLPWIIWVLAFASVVVRSSPRSPSRVAARGVVVSFALASLFGVPAQDASVTLTFWTFAFWCVSAKSERRDARPVSAAGWGLAALLVAAFVTATVSAGLTALRPPFRARDYGFGYSYGFTAGPTDGFGAPQWQPDGRAVMVVPVTERLLSLRVTAGASATADQPVDVRIWVDGQRVLKGRLSSPELVFRDVQIPDGQQATVIDAIVEPSSVGARGRNETGGPAISWAFRPLPASSR